MKPSGSWMRPVFAGVALLLCIGLTPIASAITVEDVIGLTRAQASDSIILSKIEADGTVFNLTVDEILDLKDAGVSNTVITYMINSGKNLEPNPDQGVDDTEMSQGLARMHEESAAEQEYEESGGYSDYDATGGYASGYATGGSGGLSVGVSTGGFGLYLGYYYPSFPGYYYSYYYDPFYWPRWGGYYAWCSPYPYWRWYGGWYGSGGWGYWGHSGSPYPYYGHHHGYGYERSNYEGSGRYASSRGNPGRARGASGGRAGDLNGAQASRGQYSVPRTGRYGSEPADAQRPDRPNVESWRNRPWTGDTAATRPTRDNYRNRRTEASAPSNSIRTVRDNSYRQRPPTSRGNVVQPGTTDRTRTVRRPSSADAYRNRPQQPSRSTVRPAPPTRSVRSQPAPRRTTTVKPAPQRTKTVKSTPPPRPSRSVKSAPSRAPSKPAARSAPSRSSSSRGGKAAKSKSSRGGGQ